MKKMKLKLVLACCILGGSIMIMDSCSKGSDQSLNLTSTAPPTTTNPNATPAKSFTGITFNPTTNAYFSTNGTMTAPVDSNAAKVISNKIDITFIYDFGYSEPGFLDPVARSQHWYWDGYFKSWLSNAVVTRFYSTNLTKAQFDAAASDQSQIATYFADASVVLAPHVIFPVGSCIGGRVTGSPPSLSLGMGKVYGFKNTGSGKRGLLYIRMDQATGWPDYIVSTNTNVDIIREN